ncbi:LysR family transcriptional regulator [Thalassorhabdomicrobium marinisediminis]|uniref:LysR family transcriptional regulator n=1 Tax=Thalassorhabdomicrobium marinisediminis TaxID=2170577 RepID=A0A2T7FZC3_9RHOB|nr:LysR substrate-binding domain-containing protein [Thalassorhabdomicrobium marinisediminis]PVA07524.1 LysR family transcriptional regulator [Thalassorhabdomicrobium marinisediminis]
MDSRQLKTLVAIAEHGTFARAAEVVHITPSAVSQQILALETEVGVPLFNRDKRPPTLNLQGQQLVTSAKKILRLLQDTQSAIEGKHPTGTLTIGSVRTSAIGMLPAAIVSLRNTYPELLVRLRVGMSNTLISDVLAGKLDIAVVAEHVGIPKSLRWTPFIREPLVVIAPPGTPAMPARKLLESMPFIRFHANVPLAIMIDTELSRLGITTQDTAEIDTVATIVECVSAGLGVGIVPQVALRSTPAMLTTAQFGDPQLFRHVGIVRPASSPKDQFFNEVHMRLAGMADEYGVLPPELKSS